MSKTRLVVAALAWALAASTAAGAGSSPREPSDKSKEVSENAAKAKQGNKLRDVRSCKRDARDLDGPERARFMTECIERRD